MTAKARRAERETFWTSDFVRVFLSTHLYFILMFSTFTTLPLYIEDFPEWQVGLVVGVFSVSGIVARIAAGLWVERWGRKPFVLLGALATTVAFVGYSLGTNLYLLIFLRLLHGAALGVFNVATFTQAADLAPPSRRGEAVGYLGVANSAAQTYAPALGLLMARHMGFGLYFLLAALVPLLIVGLNMGMREQANYPRVGPPPGLRGYLNKGAAYPSLIFTCYTVSLGAVQAFLPLFSQDEGVGDPGLFFLVWGVTIMAIRPLAGVLSDRIGRGAVILPSMVLGGVGMLLLGVATNNLLFYGASLLMAFGLGGANPALLAVAVDRTPPEERGVAVASFLLAFDVGGLIGTAGLGPVAGSLGFGATFITAGSITLMGALASVFMVGRAPAPGALPVRRPQKAGP